MMHITRLTIVKTNLMILATNFSITKDPRDKIPTR